MPSTPTLSLIALTETSFRATINSDVGVTNRLFYRRLPETSDTVGPTRIGPGTIDVTGLVFAGQYLVTVVSDDGSLSLPAIAAVSLLSTATLSGMLVSLFNINPAIIAVVPAGLWYGQVPEYVELPFAGLVIPTTNPNWTFEESYWDDAVAQIFIFDRGAAQVDAEATVIQNYFDLIKPPLSFPGSTAILMGMFRTNSETAVEEARARDGEIVYHAMLEYHCYVSRRIAS